MIITCCVLIVVAAVGLWLSDRIEKRRRKREIAEGYKKAMAGVRGYYVPVEGRVMNPLKAYPRNLPCFCGSTKKAKKCCVPHLLETCDAKQEPLLRSYMEEIKKVHHG